MTTLFRMAQHTMRGLQQRLPVAAAMALAISLPMVALAAALEPSLPGGVESLREVHGDWALACAIQAEKGKKTKSCVLAVLAQEQLAEDTQQRALAIELRPAAGGVKGALILPLGLALENGVTFQLDEGQPGAVQRFRTCLPAGCLVPIDFDARLVSSFKAAKLLRIKAAADDGQDTAFSIPLDDFPDVFDRTVVLIK